MENNHITTGSYIHTHKHMIHFSIANMITSFRKVYKENCSILPALSDSNSPADIITGSTPIAWNISSVWNDFPWPFPPQMPVI